MSWLPPFSFRPPFSKGGGGVGRRAPRKRLFFFAKLFSLGLLPPKKKAPSGEAPAGNLRRLLSCNRTRSPEGDVCKEKSVKQILIAIFCRNGSSRTSTPTSWCDMSLQPLTERFLQICRDRRPREPVVYKPIVPPTSYKKTNPAYTFRQIAKQ